MHLDPKAVREKAEAYAAAWSSRVPENVAAHYAEDGQIIINRGDAVVGRAAMADTAAGFYAEFPDLTVYMDDVRVAGDHVLFAWTLDGHHAETGNYVKVGGWEEWNLTGDLLVQSSLGWFDAEDYDRQVRGA